MILMSPILQPYFSYFPSTIYAYHNAIFALALIKGYPFLSCTSDTHHAKRLYVLSIIFFSKIRTVCCVYNICVRTYALYAYVCLCYVCESVRVCVINITYSLYTILDIYLTIRQFIVILLLEL